MRAALKDSYKSWAKKFRIVGNEARVNAERNFLRRKMKRVLGEADVIEYLKFFTDEIPPNNRKRALVSHIWSSNLKSHLRLSSEIVVRILKPKEPLRLDEVVLQ